MKNFLLKTCLTMLCLLVGVGASWAADATFSFSSKGYTNGQQVSSGNIDSYTTWSAKGGTNDPAYYTTGLGLRVYNGGTFTVSSTKIIASITLTFSGTGYTFSTSNTTTPQTVSPNANSYTWDVSRTCRLQKVEVTYASGGTTPTTYTVTVANNIANGTVTASSTTAAEGDEITLTATPNDGYEFGSWNVTDASSNAITVTNNKFTMPAANVNVSASFNAVGGDSGDGETTVSMSSFEAISGSVGGDAHISYEAAKGSAGTDPAVNNNEIRVYQNGGLFKITAADGYKLKAVTIGSSMATSINYKLDSGSEALSSDASISANGTYTASDLSNKSIQFICKGTDKSSRLYINYISVTYIAESTTPEKTLQSISVSGTPTKTTYTDGDAFDPAGLVVTGTYSDASTETITEGIAWNVTPATLTTGTTSVSVTATVNGITSAAYTVNGLTVNASQGGGDEPAARPENEIFYESFDTNKGTGGNDGQWSGNIALNDIKQDNEEWEYTNGKGASQCIKLGGGSALGTATTPALGQACNATLTFKAAAWNGSSESTTLKLSVIDGGTITPATITLTKGAWNTFTATLTGLTTDSKIKFEGNAASNSRFFLDEVSIVKTADVSPSKSVTKISVTGTPEVFWKGDAFNHNGITVTATYDDESTENVTSFVTFSSPDMSTAGTKTVTVTYQEQNDTYDIVVKTIANTEATAYTTAEAIALIDAGKDLTTEVYIKGTVSKVDNYNDQHHSITYWLDNNTFEVYGGLAKEGQEFTSIDDIEVGAKVVVLGKIKIYSKSTYELDLNNHLVSYEVTQPETKEYTVTYYVNGVPTTETLREGDKLNFPENPKMAGKVFRGWINQVKVEDSKTEPKYVTATTATEDATYFAVFATETVYPGAAGSDEWVELPSDFTNWRGEGIKFLLAYKVSATKAYVFDGTNNKPNYVEGKLNGKKLTKPEGAVAFILTPLGENSDYNKIELCIDNEYRYLSGKSNTNILRITNFEGATPGDKATTPTRTDFTYHNTYGWLIENCGTYMRFDGRTGYDCFWFVKKSTNNTPQYDNIALYYNQGASPDTYTYSDFTTNMDVIERDQLKSNHYFTICYPYAVHPKAYAGAKAYNVVGKTTSGDRIATLELEEVNGESYLTAGMPYFMVGEETTVSTDEPTKNQIGKFLGYHSLDNRAAEAGNHNGLYGVFADFAFSNENSGWAENEYYVISSNKVQAGTQKSGVKANRAFIKKSEVPDYVAPGESAARFIIELEEGTLTELDEVELKPIETSIYNLQGQRVNRADKGVYIVNGRKVIR